jgi:hypothetical protein
MALLKPIVFCVISFATWLIYGAPSLSMTGNALIFAVTGLHLGLVIWNREIFRVFRGDEFTYGMVTMGMNILSLLWTVVSGLIIVSVYGREIAALSSLPSMVWGIMSLGLLGAVLLPVLSTRSVAPLPDRDERRTYENPRSD